MVTAMDITKMSAAGIERIRKALVSDPRTWYVIHAGKIWSRTHGFRPQPYSGSNPHMGHLHVSLVQTGRAVKDDGPWGITKTVKAVKKAPPVTPQAQPATIQRGSKGELVSAVQGFLGIDPVTGHFGPLTMAQVKRYQRQHNLVDDGIVGPKTWAVIRTALKIPAHLL
jgi:peptidoglycan hydrolase-like protein with peptidoglycan-binding domain